MTTVQPADAELERLRAAMQWLVRLRESGDDEALIGEWLAWLDAAPENAEAFEQIKDTWQVAGAAATLLPRHAESPARGRWWRRLSSRNSLRIAAAVVLAIAGTLLLRPQAPQGEQTLSTPVAIHGSSLLPDGSKVELGARSRISTHFDDGVRRIVIEAGEAYFEVAHDKTRPFVVQAGALSVTAVGTAFNVRRGDEQVVVTVAEGRVRLEDRAVPARWSGAGKPKAPMEAGAGEQAVYSARERRIDLAAANPEVAIAWRGGVLKFVHEPLHEVVANLNRYSPRQIELGDPSLGRLRFSGTVFSNRLEDWLQAVESIFPLHVTYEGADRIVLVPGKPQEPAADTRDGEG